MIVVAVFFFSFLLCFCDWLLLFVLLFLFLQNIFVRAPIPTVHPHTPQTFGVQTRQWWSLFPSRKKQPLNDFFNLLYVKLWSEKSANIWRADKTVVVTVPFEKKTTFKWLLQFALCETLIWKIFLKQDLLVATSTNRVSYHNLIS